MARLLPLFLLFVAACAVAPPPSVPRHVGRGVHPGDIVHLVTGVGTIDITLYDKQAPENCASVVDLIAFGFYDGMLFYELSDSWVKTGCPRNDGLGGPGYYVPDEIDPVLRFDRAGVVAMASDGPNTNGSQIFITRRPLPELDGKFTIIGQVSGGLTVLDRLQPAMRIERAWVQGRY
jgi:cyclophilin family peptidyl-prolyl cis-trans isomerase